MDGRRDGGFPNSFLHSKIRVLFVFSVGDTEIWLQALWLKYRVMFLLPFFPQKGKRIPRTPLISFRLKFNRTSPTSSLATPNDDLKHHECQARIARRRHRSTASKSQWEEKQKSKRLPTTTCRCFSGTCGRTGPRCKASKDPSWA